MNAEERSTSASETVAPEAGGSPAVADTVEPIAHPAAARVRPRTLWLTVTASALLGIMTFTAVSLGWHLFALASIAQADRNVVTASDELADVTDLRGVAIDKARAALESMTEFSAHPLPAYVHTPSLESAREGLQETSAGLTHTTVDAPELADIGNDFLPWTVIGNLQDKQKLVAQLEATRKARAAELTALDTAQDRFSANVKSVYRALAEHGEHVLTASDSATYESTIELRNAIAAGATEATGSQFGGTGLLSIIAAIEGVNAAQAAGEAAKQDPAYPVRAQIMEYARSIAHGVTLDFEWHELVSGRGGDWYSGTALSREDNGGWATIDLNFGVQDGWRAGDVDAKALVTHEVGHTQAVRPECKPLFTGAAFNSDHEMWATAWAISMGFDTGGSGISAYGRPSNEQIAVAGQCR